MCDQDILHDMPTSWWLASKEKGAVRHCNYLLAALVHRHNPDVIPDPKDAPAGPPREVIRNKVKEARSIAVEEAKSGPRTERGKHEDAMLAAKAAMMQKNVELQECEVVKEQLMMLKEFKASFVSGYNKDGEDGKKEFDSTVMQCLNQLPIMKKRRTTDDDVNGEK